MGLGLGLGKEEHWLLLLRLLEEEGRVGTSVLVQRRELEAVAAIVVVCVSIYDLANTDNGLT